MDTLVTGGAGFAGQHLVRRLLTAGHRVTIIDLQRSAATDELRDMGAALVFGSITDGELVNRAMAGHQLVYHLASAFRDIYAPDAQYWDVDVNGTRRVLEAAERSGVRRVVHVSTQGVHGSLAQTPGDEDSPIAPLDYYCHAKYHAEVVCQEFIERGLDVVIARPTSIYGPGDTHGWLKLFRMVQAGRFLMIGDGRTLNHPLFVENLVDFLEIAGTAPQARGRTYLVGDADAVTLERLVHEIAAALGVKLRVLNFPSYRLAWLGATAVEYVCRPLGISPPIFRRRLSWFRTNRAFSIERARRELGYEPRVSLPEGLGRTAAWYGEQRLLHAPAPPTEPPTSRRPGPARAQDAG